MFDNIFAATYKFYSKFKNEDARFGAVAVLTVCQFTLLFLLFVILRKVTGLDLFALLPNKYYFIPVFVLWIFLIFKHYNKARVVEVVKAFDAKSKTVRKNWGFIALASFILPTVFIAVLLTK